MPTHIVLTTPQEVFASAVTAAKELSERIMKLSDLNQSPLAPGETADMRRHQLAKFGKKLAEAFLVIDNLMQLAAEHVAAHHGGDVTAGPTKPPDDSNAN